MLNYQRVRFVSTGQSCVATAWKKQKHPQIGQSLVDLYDVFLRWAKHDLLPFHSLLHLAVAPWLTIERFGWFFLDMSEVLDVEQRCHSCMFIVLYHVDSWLQDSLVIGVPFSAKEMAKFIVNSRIFIARGGRSGFPGLWEVEHRDNEVPYYSWARFDALRDFTFGIIWDHLGDLKSHFFEASKQATSTWFWQVPHLTCHLRHGAKDCGLVQHRGPGFTESFVPSRSRWGWFLKHATLHAYSHSGKTYFRDPPKREHQNSSNTTTGSKDFDYMGGHQRLKFADTWYSCRKSTPF